METCFAFFLDGLAWLGLATMREWKVGLYHINYITCVYNKRYYFYECVFISFFR